MAGLILIPPSKDIYGIVTDMIPVIAPGADRQVIEQSVILIQRLFVLCKLAKLNPTTEKLFVAMFSSLVEIDQQPGNNYLGVKFETCQKLQ
jgi:hypothetical protein